MSKNNVRFLLRPPSHIRDICQAYVYYEFHSRYRLDDLPVVKQYVAETLESLGNLSLYEVLPDAEIIYHLANGRIRLLKRRYKT
jgi:hypothetical protein